MGETQTITAERSSPVIQEWDAGQASPASHFFCSLRDLVCPTWIYTATYSFSHHVKSFEAGHFCKSQTNGGTVRTRIKLYMNKGQGLVEYALVLVLIAIVVIFLLTFIGMEARHTFSQIGSGLGR